MHSHAPNIVADWELVAPDKRNPWQQRAAETKGWDTPGNRETAKGALLSFAGVALIASGRTALGTALFTIGRYKDTRDGKVADETGTKSPLGAMIDPLVDRAVMVAAVPVMVGRGIMSGRQVAALAAQEAAIAAPFALGKGRGMEMHSRPLGQISGVFKWGSMIAKCAGKAAEEQGFNNIGSRLQRFGDKSVNIGIGIGAIAAIDYTVTALRAGHNAQTI